MSDENRSSYKYPIRIFGLGYAIANTLRYMFGEDFTPACSTIAGVYFFVNALKNGLANRRNFLMALADSLIFDCLASIIIPSFITYHVCSLENLNANGMIEKLSRSKPNFLEIDVADISKIGRNTGGDLFRRIKTELVGQIFYSKSDTFRKVPLRLLGYGYAVAEALRHRVNDDHQEGNPFCMLAGGFIICHCLDRMLAVAEEPDGWINKSRQNRPTDMLIAFCDTFIWEALASVTIPTFLTYCAVKITDVILEILCTECYTVRRWLPVTVGIAVVPLFMVSVDTFVDRLMDDTVREIYAPSLIRLAI